MTLTLLLLVGMMSNIMAKKQKPNQASRTIALNKKARHDYTLETHYEAGLALEGWEVKALRAGRVQLKESYILLKKGEAWLIGAHISPLPSTCTHYEPDPLRSRKLLLHAKELSKLFAAKEREGYTVVPLDLHWHKNRVKVEIATAKGKKQHDKRESNKQRDWEREKHRLLKR